MQTMKRFTIDDSGNVIPANRFGGDCPVIEAATKADAQREFLRQFRDMKRFGAPDLRIKNDAFQIIWHCGSEVVSETGTILRSATFPENIAVPSCSAGFSTRGAAKRDKSFDYYSSDEYRDCVVEQIRLQRVQIETKQAIRA